jgi:hypothetical protein
VDYVQTDGTRKASMTAEVPTTDGHG